MSHEELKRQMRLVPVEDLEEAQAEIAELKAQLASPMLRCHKAGHQDEIDALKAEFAELQKVALPLIGENAKLREALKKHKHTDECWRYAAKTNRNCGQFYCIADCANSHVAVLGEIE